MHDEPPAAGLAQGSVLLTGVTGFLGAHLLRELLERSDAHVTCLVRGDGPDAAKHSAKRRLDWYFPDLDWQRHGGRVRFVAGDIGAPALGLDGRLYDELAETHALVLNSAANVSHVGAASQSFRVNTDGVAALLELARRGVQKQFHHVSTVSVQGQLSGTGARAGFDETQLELGQTFRNAYAESKYRAEVLVRKAFSEGLAGAVYRVGYIGPHGGTGRFQPNMHQSHIARYVRACVGLGFAPHLPDAKVTLTPVDSVARGILTLARAGAARQTYYVVTPHDLRLAQIVGVLHAAGYPIRLMSAQEFTAKAARLSRDEEALTTMLPGNASGESGLAYDSSASQRELAKLGFEYPRPTSDWLALFVAHAIQEGFLEAPRFWNAAPMVSQIF
jgi:thioester reductase-like protein